LTSKQYFFRQKGKKQNNLWTFILLKYSYGWDFIILALLLQKLTTMIISTVFSSNLYCFFQNIWSKFDKTFSNYHNWIQLRLFLVFNLKYEFYTQINCLFKELEFQILWSFTWITDIKKIIWIGYKITGCYGRHFIHQLKNSQNCNCVRDFYYLDIKKSCYIKIVLGHIIIIIWNW